MSEYRTAASASVETSLDRKRARFRQCAATPAIVAWSASSCSERRDPATEACYRPPADGPLGRRSGCWYGRWLSSGQRLSAVCVACRSLDLALPKKSVERAICRSRRCFHRAGSVSSWVPSGWPWVLGIHSVGRPPHCDVADEGGAQLASRCSPDRLGVTLAGVVLDLVGEVGDQLGSLGQIGPPDGLGMERFWYAGEPGQRTWADTREFWEAPVEDGGHVACGREIATARGFL